jgi:hypothetical protein
MEICAIVRPGLRRCQRGGQTRAAGVGIRMNDVENFTAAAPSGTAPADEISS